MGSPLNTVAAGQTLRISFSLRPMPLPSWVQNGMMVFPEKSYPSRKVKTAMWAWTLTAMSPLQYQKMLRLNEARRLMLAERLDATTAAFNVGYESASQFCREYGRLFGAPPLRDINRLRQTSAAA